MTTKHTPGPWSVTKAKHGVDMSHYVVALATPDRNDRALVVHAEQGDDGQGDANARLIAAAPELLEALEWALRAMEARNPLWAEGERFVAARATIAKAKGEQQ